MRALRARAQGIAEYALILLFIVMVVVVAIVAFGQTLRTNFETINNCFADPEGANCGGDGGS